MWVSPPSKVAEEGTVKHFVKAKVPVLGMTVLPELKSPPERASAASKVPFPLKSIHP